LVIEQLNLSLLPSKWVNYITSSFDKNKFELICSTDISKIIRVDRDYKCPNCYNNTTPFLSWPVEYYKQIATIVLCHCNKCEWFKTFTV